MKKINIIFAVLLLVVPIISIVDARSSFYWISPIREPIAGRMRIIGVNYWSLEFFDGGDHIMICDGFTEVNITSGLNKGYYKRPFYWAGNWSGSVYNHNTLKPYKHFPRLSCLQGEWDFDLTGDMIGYIHLSFDYFEDGMFIRHIERNFTNDWTVHKWHP